MISHSLILQILQGAKIMRRFFYEAPAEIMRIYTTIEYLMSHSFLKSNAAFLNRRGATRERVVEDF